MSKVQRTPLDLARELAKRPVTRESALKSLTSAGILDKKGKISKNYPELRRFMSSPK